METFDLPSGSRSKFRIQKEMPNYLYNFAGSMSIPTGLMLLIVQRLPVIQTDR